MMTRIAEAATTASRGGGGRLIIITRRARAPVTDDCDATAAVDRPVPV